MKELEIKIRNLKLYKNWKRRVINIYGIQCSQCEFITDGIEVHHITSLKEILTEHNPKSLKEALEIEDIFNVFNGICLCGDCHRDVHIYLNNIKST